MDTRNHCHTEFDYVLDPKINVTRSYSFSEIEQNIIDNEVEKFLDRGIIMPSLSGPGDIVSPIFTRLKKDGSHRVIFNVKKFNESGHLPSF